MSRQRSANRLLCTSARTRSSVAALDHGERRRRVSRARPAGGSRGRKEHLARRSTAACGARRSGAACGLGGLEGHPDRRPLGGSAAADGRSGRAERRLASAARAREGGDRDARRRVFAPRGAGRGRRPPLRAARPRCAAAAARRALGRPPRRVGAVARIAVRRPLVRELPPGGDRAARRAPADGARGSRRGRDRARRARRRDSRRRPAGRAAPGSRAALPSPDACVLQGGAAAGGARRLRGDARSARRAVGTRTLPRDPRAPPDDPLAGSRACPHPSRLLAAIGTVRRPVSLLLVEPLLDDDLELEAAGAVVQDVRRTVADVVSRHGGALSPESGVELVAAFGADGAHEDDVVRAARAGVEIREVLRGRDVQARLAIGTGRLARGGLDARARRRGGRPHEACAPRRGSGRDPAHRDRRAPGRRRVRAGRRRPSPRRERGPPAAARRSRAAGRAGGGARAPPHGVRARGRDREARPRRRRGRGGDRQEPPRRGIRGRRPRRRARRRLHPLRPGHHLPAPP